MKWKEEEKEKEEKKDEKEESNISWCSQRSRSFQTPSPTYLASRPTLKELSSLGNLVPLTKDGLHILYYDLKEAKALGRMLSVELKEVMNKETQAKKDKEALEQPSEKITKL